MTKALIIGGGIAGPVAAVALQQAGIDSVVYEAYDRGADGVGAFLTLAVNGMDVLRTLDLYRVVGEEGFDTPAFAFFSGTGKRLGGMANGRPLSDGTVSRTVKRSALYSALRDEAVRRGIRIEYGKRLTDAGPTPDARVVARFADGTTAEGDLLIGADGLRSRSRQIIDPASPPARYIGLLNTGGYVRGVPVDATTGTMNMVFGKRSFFCYVLHPDGEIWWFANPPRKQEPTRAELRAITPEQWREELIGLFAGDRTPAVEIIRRTDEIVPPWPTHDFPSVPTWHTDRMIIIGDAAHATSPASGQGASMAMEDAVVLAKALRDCQDVPRAFAAYERLRRERVERVVVQGKRNGDVKAVGPIARVVRDLMFPLVFKWAARRSTDPQAWITGYRVAWETPIGEPSPAS
jgi:FAD-dependent urate hydroxylase